VLCARFPAEFDPSKLSYPGTLVGQRQQRHIRVLPGQLSFEQSVAARESHIELVDADSNAK
jgi:hypothetical protein